MEIKEFKTIINNTEADVVSVNGKVLVNCTPHTINYYENGDILFSVPPSNLPIIRVKENNIIDNLSGITITRKSYGSIENLPEERDDYLYIVSALVFNAVNRIDIIAPDTDSGAIRNGDGQIQGTTRFVVK